MSGTKRGIVRRLLPWLIVFAAGGATGYWVRDQRQDQRLQEAIERARDDLMERGRDLGDAAKDSARSALRRLAGDSS